MTYTQDELFPSVNEPAGDGAIELAAATTITALRSTGTLDASHSLKVELIMQGARALDREMVKDKITVAATTLFSRVVDIADGLPTVQEAMDSAFQQLVDAMEHAD